MTTPHRWALRRGNATLAIVDTFEQARDLAVVIRAVQGITTEIRRIR